MAAEGRAIRRIVDYLNDGEEVGIDGVARSSMPKFRWPRLSRLGGKGGGCGKQKTVFVAEKSEQVPVAVSTSVEQAARKCEPASTSGAKYSDPSLGVSLVFLLAKTSDEFNKMVKVRTEMEALLEEVRLQVSEANGGGSGHGNMPDEAPRNDPESTTSSCVTDRNDRRAGARMEERAVSPGTEAASCEKSEECCGMVDGLEDEVQADLERLQVTHGSHVPLFAAEEEIDSEPSGDIDDYRQEDDGESGEVVEDAEDIIDDDDDDEAEYNGVSAVELERRLHELLHEQNRERIEELEAALRRAAKKLAEKEMEVCLWKDAAKFVLRKENELQ